MLLRACCEIEKTKLCFAGDEVQLKEYERLSELKVSPRPLGTLEKVRPACI